MIGPGGDWQSVLDAADDWDVIQVREGAPAPVSVHLSRRVIIENYPGERPVLDAAGAYTGIYLEDGSTGTLVRGLEFRNYTGGALREHNAEVDLYVRDCVFDNVKYGLTADSLP